MSDIADVVRVRVWAAIWPTMFALSSAGAFDEDEVAKRHVVVNVYAGDELTRTATGVVIGTGVVLADAEIVAKGRRHSVLVAGGAEIAASVSQTDEALSLAVLQVPGLDQPALPFALREIGADKNRFVHSVFYDPDASPGTRFGFGKVRSAPLKRLRRGVQASRCPSTGTMPASMRPGSAARC